MRAARLGSCLALLLCACMETDSQGAELPAAGSGATGAASAGAHADRGRAARRDERLAMVREQIEARGVRDPRVLDALRAVPREWFVPPASSALAYSDQPLPIGADQTISQPYIVACMTEALALTPGARVLEIGTGSGYQAAVLAELTPHVFSIEIVPELAARARETLLAHDYATIALREGDGYAGWPEAAPFDAIIVTAAPPHVPPALIVQLRAGGRLCLPVGGRADDQELLVIRKDTHGSLHEERLFPVRFVPMTGEAQKPGPP